MTEPQQQMVITGEQMSRVYNAGSMKDVHSVMDEIRDITENTRSRPIPAAQEHIRLNTQPDGCDCGDCIRYGKDECPYPGSNPTMVMCNSFLLDIKQHDATIYLSGKRKIRCKKCKTEFNNLKENTCHTLSH